MFSACKNLARSAQRHGAAAAITRLGRRMLHRWLGVEVNQILLLEAGHLASRPNACDPAFEFAWLSSAELLHLAREPELELSHHFAQRAATGLDRCFGAWHDGTLASYSWYAIDSIEPEHCGGIPLSLPNRTAYMYKAYTRPEYRGRKLYGAGIALAFTQLRVEGIEQLVALVDWTNLSSLRACHRLGFEDLGRLIRWGADAPARFSVSREAGRRGLRFGAQADLSLRQMALAGTIQPSEAPAPGDRTFETAEVV